MTGAPGFVPKAPKILVLYTGQGGMESERRVPEWEGREHRHQQFSTGGGRDGAFVLGQAPFSASPPAVTTALVAVAGGVWRRGNSMPGPGAFPTLFLLHHTSSCTFSLQKEGYLG